MLLKLLEKNRPVDYVVYCDTTIEYPGMYEHLKKLEDYTHLKFIRLKSDYSFEYYFREHIPKRKNNKFKNYKGYSWPGPRVRWCTTKLKTDVINKYFKELSKKYELYYYIGIAYDEQLRIKKDKTKIYPLVEYKMTEKDCLKYCYDHGFNWNGLYEIFDRVSCWCCPLQSLKSLRNLRRYFPKLWSKLEKMDEQTFSQFRLDYSIKELNIRFDLEEKRLKENKSIKNHEFYKELKELLELKGER